MNNLELLIFLSFVGYLNTILIPETYKVLNDPLDIGEFMRWIGFWSYMACWIRIPDSHDVWSVTPPVMHIGAPVNLKKYMSRHCFDEILAFFCVQIGKCSMRVDSYIQVRWRRHGKKITDEFNPSCVNVFDDIIMEWYNNCASKFMLVTLDDLEGGNTKCNYIGRDGESLVKFPNIGSRLDFTFGTFIR